ncbi:MAG: hypothetical protein ACLSHC_10895 [Bilophila wadsworthia]
MSRLWYYPNLGTANTRWRSPPTAPWLTLWSWTETDEWAVRRLFTTGPTRGTASYAMTQNYNQLFME